jgi:hypothetical protein
MTRSSTFHQGFKAEEAPRTTAAPLEPLDIAFPGNDGLVGMQINKKHRRHRNAGFQKAPSTPGPLLHR